MNKLDHLANVQAKTPLSEDIAKDMKKRGFKFCGPVIVYAVMQAMGMVNDHEVRCPRYREIQRPKRRARPEGGGYADRLLAVAVLASSGCAEFGQAVYNSAANSRVPGRIQHPSRAQRLQGRGGP